jgi:hypothetical protein
MKKNRKGRRKNILKTLKAAIKKEGGNQRDNYRTFKQSGYTTFI